MRTSASRIAVATAFVLLSLAPLGAAETGTRDVTRHFVEAGIVADQLRAVEVGGMLILRGRTADPAVAAAAGTLARSLGYSRVANLVQVVQPADDSAIQRMAERELAIHRSLDGCNISVDSNNGVVRVAGLVNHELQKDVAVQLLRRLNGVRAVQSDLRRF